MTAVTRYCGKLCTARTPIYVNCCCWPFVLIWQSIAIYLMPCIRVCLGRCMTYICCCWCRWLCPEFYKYADDDFPPNHRSLELKDKELEESVVWIRAHELAQNNDSVKLVVKGKEEEHSRNPVMHLFEDGIRPDDVVQGALGDCWLLAAIACMAEFPGTYEVSERHKYGIQLYDARKGVESFKKIYIDDYIPCSEKTKRPVFADPKGNELWVLLLEKAFAKFLGSYGRLEGGHTMWAFQAMTGNECLRFEFDRSPKGPCWRKWTIRYDEATHRNPREDYGWVDDGEAFDNKRMWSLLMRYDKNTALISASASNDGEHQRDDGIVEGHAYTVTGVYAENNIKILNLRNPWGTFEWKGKWSDGDTETWDKHPKIAKKVGFVAEDDGSFWMSYEDFQDIYNVIQICDRTTIQNLHLSVNEDDDGKLAKYKLSMVKGCLTGCCTYWCLCRGLRNIYCGRAQSSKSVVTPGNKLLSLFCPCIDQNTGEEWTD